MELYPSASSLSEVNPLKSPDFSDVMPLDVPDSEVIAARCVSVTSSALLIPGTALTILSRTCCVRSLSGGSISLTSVTLMLTLILSVKFPSSETVIVTE